LRAHSPRAALLRLGIPVAAALLLAGCTSGATSGGSTSADTGSGSSAGSSSSGSGGTPAKIATVPGGPSAYFDSWNDGSAAAGKDFNISKIVNQVPPSITFSVDTQNQTIDTLAGQGYNGFAVFPDDAKGSNTEFSKLAARGIKTLAVAGCTDDPSPVLFCLATDVKQGAYNATKYAIEKMGGSGDLAALTGLLTDPNTQLRLDGVKQAVAETNGKVNLVQVVGNDDTPTVAKPNAQNLLAARGSTLKGIVATSYYSSAGVANVMLDQPQYRKIVTVLEDNDPSVMKALSQGAITATLWQNPYGQAYLASYVLNQVIAHGCTVAADAPFATTPQTKKFVNSGFAIIDSSNLSTYANGPYSVPTQTTEVKKLIDDKILSCG
jgi:ribose transport system substrate-binding protein